MLFLHSHVTVVMEHYCAKPLAQLPKHMHILHCCYKLVDNIVPVHKLKAVKAMGITLLLDLAMYPKSRYKRKSVELAVTALCVSDVTSYEYLHY